MYDVVGKKIGVLNGGQIGLKGYYDPSDTGMSAVITKLTDGSAFTSTDYLRLWESDTSGDSGFGYWQLSTGVGAKKLYVTGFNASRAANGMGEIDVTLEVDGLFVYSTAT